MTERPDYWPHDRPWPPDGGAGNDKGRGRGKGDDGPLDPGEQKPTIEIRPGEIGRIVDQVEAALIAANRGLYRRGCLIVSVGVDKVQTFDGKTIETQVIEERGDYALLEDLEAVAEFVRAGDKKAKKCAPPVAIGRTLKDRRYRLRFPALVALTNCPTIKANGDLITRPGFIGRPAYCSTRARSVSRTSRTCRAAAMLRRRSTASCNCSTPSTSSTKPARRSPSRCF